MEKMMGVSIEKTRADAVDFLASYFTRVTDIEGSAERLTSWLRLGVYSAHERLAVLKSAVLLTPIKERAVDLVIKKADQLLDYIHEGPKRGDLRGDE